MSDAYLGNPNLKKINTPVEFTEEQIVEFRKCENDPVYFIPRQSSSQQLMIQLIQKYRME